MLFLKYLRNEGFVTPLLEGIDISANDGADLGLEHRPLLDLGDVVVIPVNSSNYCGILQNLAPFSAEDFALLQERAASDAPLAGLLTRFDELRLVDICRVSKGQTEALSNRMHALDSDGRLRLRIVVLHHQLLPVNVEEEVKPFETMVNLGFFRQWLGHNGAHVVLHGHKHSSDAYLDLPGVSPILLPGQCLGDGAVMVSSVAAANDERPFEIARLVEVDTPGATTRSIAIYGVPSTYPKLKLADFPKVAASVVSLTPCPSRIRVFEGPTFDAVYHQLLATFRADSFEPSYDVVCRIVDGATGRKLPEGYPVPEGEDPQTWFDETVAWWQNPEPQLVSPQFNHGERIWRAPHNVNQFALAMDQLQRTGTSRAVMLLVDPQVGQQALYPAMCLVQLRIPADTTRLDCVAYFRKQQMRAWWPINVGELADLQHKAIAQLGGLTPGEILTISAIALGGSDRPRVVVPRIDRWSQDNPSALMSLVLATFSPEHPDRATAMDQWISLFSDWQPTEMMERDGVPLALRGITALADAVEICARSFRDPRADVLAMDLRDLSRMTHSYWFEDSASTDDHRRHERYEQWWPQADHAIDRVLGHVRMLLTGSSA